MVFTLPAQWIHPGSQLPGTDMQRARTEERDGKSVTGTESTRNES